MDSYLCLDISFIHQACNYNYVDLTQARNIWLASVQLAHPCIYNSLAYLPRTHNLDIRTRALSLSHPPASLPAGLMVPNSKAAIHFAPCVGPSALEDVALFSHMWVLFVFHE